MCGAKGGKQKGGCVYVSCFESQHQRPPRHPPLPWIFMQETISYVECGSCCGGDVVVWW